MKRILIGHRGAGKSSLLKRHKDYFPDLAHFDLDAEIENSCGLSISQYFDKNGETAFRKTELEIFNKLIENNNFVICLGAGFDVTKIPKEFEVVFVSRVTDRDGRLFLNRPRLESGMTALEEYKKRYDERHSKFIECATWTYYLPEGIEQPNAIEKQILTGWFRAKEAYLTLNSKDLNRIGQLTQQFEKIELRTDLLEDSVIEELAQKYPQQNFLLSIRGPTKIQFENFHNIDCDVQFFNEAATIISSHEDNIDLSLLKLRIFSNNYGLKLSPLVENFADLIKGHFWQQEDPEKRSFLPRSKSGKWIWYRQWARYSQALNFVKNSQEVLDQPSLYEWLSLPLEQPDNWGAVLGSPVYFSRSPLAHQTFFKERNSYFTRIDLSADELGEYHSFLILLGLKYAAVTSPLKEKLFSIATVKTKQAEELKSANTLLFANNRLSCHNTDLDGFLALMQTEKPGLPVAVWGGGGTLQMLKQALPNAVLFSSQTGQTREVQSEQITHFKALVWAAPRTAQTQFPSDTLNFESVIDLNYTENSMGLEFAARRKISYISGLEMFKAQAEAQQVFWRAQEGNS